MEDGREVAANLEQQAEEVAVLQAICGPDFMVLSPVVSNAVAEGCDSSGAGGGSSPGDAQCTSGSIREPADTLEPHAGCAAAAGEHGEAALPDMAALAGKEALVAQASVHVQLAAGGLPFQVRRLSPGGGRASLMRPNAAPSQPDVSGSCARALHAQIRMLASTWQSCTCW